MRTIWIFIFLIIFSCQKKETFYSYNGICIKRIDVAGKSEFYYQKSGKENSKIWVEYSGINDGFSGYLWFLDDGKVLLLSGDGYFQTKNIDTESFQYKKIFRYERPGNLPNVYKIYFPIEVEKEKNLNTKSKIKILYK